MVSPAWLPGGAGRRIRQIEHDVLNLHWIADGFLSIENVGRQEKPLNWTLHDMWLFTGGCHFSGSCDKYKGSCGNCPLLASERSVDLSRITWKRKARSWSHLRPTVVSPARWLADAARDSPLMAGASIQVIPNGVDIRQFQPFDRSIAREAFGLPEGKLLVAFGALSLSERRKGGAYLADALRKIDSFINPESAQLVVFGGSEPSEPLESRMQARYIGRLSDDVSLALLYAAVDVVVIPSRYEAHPLVAIEAMACGTPCVAFSVAGLSEVFVHGKNGLLATPFDTSELAQAIAELLTNHELRVRAAQGAREKAVSNWDIDDITKQYAALYASVC
jgi:glycosyltransferase involved in cell wall biosynthesis